MTHSIPTVRFYSLDVLRGVAALSVVLWHWQHFFLPYNRRGLAFSMDQQPLFEVLYVFYQYGYKAVELFFCLSGFIFFWLYSKHIAERAITLRYFSLLRLSRLYPLHFVTLIFVVLGQLVYKSITGAYFVYPFNDIYHFILNVFFASSWGFEKGFSFNAPIWSVSVEILLYLIFFVFCRVFHRNIIALLFAVMMGFFLGAFSDALASGVKGFFLGGLLFIAYQQIIKTGDAWKISIWLPFVALTAWLVTIGVTHPGHDLTFGESRWIIGKIISNWTVLILFPATILSLALIESKRGTLGRRISFLGDISYSSYLLHFPLQLSAVIVSAKLNIGQALFYSPWFMALFFFVLILISFASHRSFEVPMQRFLRRQSALGIKKNEKAAQ